MFPKGSKRLKLCGPSGQKVESHLCLPLKGWLCSPEMHFILAAPVLDFAQSGRVHAAKELGLPVSTLLLAPSGLLCSLRGLGPEGLPRCSSSCLFPEQNEGFGLLPSGRGCFWNRLTGMEIPAKYCSRRSRRKWAFGLLMLFSCSC